MPETRKQPEKVIRRARTFRRVSFSWNRIRLRSMTKIGAVASRTLMTLRLVMVMPVKSNQEKASWLTSPVPMKHQRSFRRIFRYSLWNSSRYTPTKIRLNVIRI